MFWFVIQTAKQLNPHAFVYCVLCFLILYIRSRSTRSEPKKKKKSPTKKNRKKEREKNGQRGIRCLYQISIEHCQVPTFTLPVNTKSKWNRQPSASVLPLSRFHFLAGNVTSCLAFKWKYEERKWEKELERKKWRKNHINLENRWREFNSHVCIYIYNIASDAIFFFCDANSLNVFC